MAKMWIATYVDRGDTCDGKARVLKVCRTRDEARSEILSNMVKWHSDRDGNAKVDFDRLSARLGDESCEWNCEEVDVDVGVYVGVDFGAPSSDVVALTESRLRNAERGLETIGRSICSVPGSGPAHGHVGRAVEAVQAAIHECYRMG